MSYDILIKKGWNMISYPDETSVSSLNIQPKILFLMLGIGIPDLHQMLIIQIVFINQSTQPAENREFIERTYVDSGCPFPNGRFYKVDRMYPVKVIYYQTEVRKLVLLFRTKQISIKF